MLMRDASPHLPRPHWPYPRANEINYEAIDSAKITILPDGTIIIDQNNGNFRAEVAEVEVEMIDDRVEDVIGANENENVDDIDDNYDDSYDDIDIA